MLQAPTPREPDLARRFVTWLGRLGPAEPQQVASLCLVPLTLDGKPGRPLLLMHQAIERGVLRIREQGRGRVSQIRAKNRGDQPVIVLEGETLLGCKQNRIVIRSSILPPLSERPIAVRCIEEDRWAWSSGAFMTGSMRASPLLGGAGLDSAESPGHVDQRRIWRKIRHLLDACGVHSHSSDYHALLEERDDDLRRLARRFRVERRQVGVVAIHGGRMLGIEMTDHPDTWKQIAKRTLPAYLLAVESDSAAEPAGPFDPTRIARNGLRMLRTVRVGTSKGDESGSRFTVVGDGLSGAGLWHAGRAVHLSARVEALADDLGAPAV